MGNNNYELTATPELVETKQYIFNLETTKIELHFEKSEYDVLSATQKAMLKSAYLWSNRGKCWVSRAKEPNLWRAKEVAKALGFSEEKREGERLSYAEQIERKSERAEAKAERYDNYADNASRRSEALQKPLNDMRGDTAFFTQPNINTSAGRSFTRRREKIFERYEKGFNEYRKSEYFRKKADLSRETASQSHLKDAAYLDRKIRECKKEIAKRNERAKKYEKLLETIENGQEAKRYDGTVLTAKEVQEWYNNELELIEVAIDKQGFFENCLDELGGIKFSKDNIKVGYIVKMQRFGLGEIISVGNVNVVYKILNGGAAGDTLKAAYSEIIEIVKAEEREKTAHPFKVGEKYIANIYNSENRKFESVEYEIVKASAATIQLKPVGADTKPITRKPALYSDGKKWRFSIDDSYRNTFYKEAAI